MRRTIAITAFCLLGLSAVQAQSAPRADDPCAAGGAVEGSSLTVHYLANEGVMVEAGDRKVLVDALFGDGIAGYAAVPERLRAGLESGSGKWDGVDLLLATHYHGDHFDPEAVGRYLASEPETLFVSTPQAVDRLRRTLGPSSDLLDRSRAALPAEGETDAIDRGGVAVEVLHLHHGRDRRPPVENLGFVVTIDNLSFLHFGDTEAKLEEFEPYLELLEGTDVALLPFWFLASEWRAAMVRDRIRPRAIVVLHLPSPDAGPGYFGRWGSYDALLSTIRAAFPEAIVPAAAGDRWELPAPCPPSGVDEATGVN